METFSIINMAEAYVGKWAGQCCFLGQVKFGVDKQVDKDDHGKPNYVCYRTAPNLPTQRGPLVSHISFKKKEKWSKIQTLGVRIGWSLESKGGVNVMKLEFSLVSHIS